MTQAELESRMLNLLTRADEVAASFLALDADLRALARDLSRASPRIGAAAYQPEVHDDC